MDETELKIKRKAGVVVWRRTPNGGIEILLISSRMKPVRWIFPSGTVDPGETLPQTAARECAEESGVVVTVGPELGTIDVPRADIGQVHRITFFLAQPVGEAEDWEMDRERMWAPLAELADYMTLDRVLVIAHQVMGFPFGDE